MHPMMGRLVVAAVVLGSLLAVAGTIVYRHHARARAAAELSNPAIRERAFRTLLRMNGLQGFANDYAHDPRPDRRGKAYLEGNDLQGRRLLIVRARRITPPHVARPAAFVFTANGRIIGCIEGAEIHVSKDGSSALIVGEPEETEPDRRSILLPANRCREALRIRGPFALETADGAIAFRDGDGPPAADLPLFAYDPAAACFRGPPGSPRDRWEVIAMRSPLFQPSTR